MIAAARRQELIKEHRRSDDDTGSPEIQVAVLTERIRELTEHLRTHKHDHASRRGLLLMVGKRGRLLKYLSRTRRGDYQALIERLQLRK